jgi:hypothetical protein
MRPFALRRLTAGERALAAEVFGAALDPDRVRILALPFVRRALVAGIPLIVWPARQAADDFSAAPLRLRATFVHELTHVWQAQSGVNLVLAKLRCGDSAASYSYRLEPDASFADFNIEQQAMAVEHAYLARHGAPAPYPAERLAAFLPAWGQG